MTILSKKKGSSTKSEVDNVDHHNVVPHQASHSIPHPQLQPENLSLGPFAASIWSAQTHSHNHNIGATDKRNSQPHYDDYQHIDANNTHGKRRHSGRRVSPMRCSRSKQSRVERDRTATSSPNTSSNGPSVGSSSPESSTNSIVPQNTTNSEVSCNSVSCNSEDEYETRPSAQLTEEEWTEREKRFEKKVMKKRLVIRKMNEDGACLFRAVADQVYGDQEMHMIVRNHCMDYIAANADYFSQYVTEDFDHYVSRKRLENVHGNHVEIQAMSEMYNRTIEVFCYSTEPINIFHGQKVKTDNEPIRLSYHRGVHYNSIVDPYKATVGVGLGLPGYCPGLADKNILKEATRQSEEVHIEQAMLEDKLRATDWEATNEAIEEQVARESYLQWLKDNQRRNRAARSPTASSSSETVTSSATGEMRSPRSWAHSSNISPIGSPFHNDTSIPSTSKTLTSQSTQSTMGAAALSPSPSSNISENFQQTATFLNQLPPEMFGLQEDWDETGILARVLAVSQQEYLDVLKSNNTENNN